MILTEEIFEEGKSKYGSWSDEQIRCFGIEKYKNKGWKQQIIGGNYPENTITRFLALKDAHLKENTKVKNTKVKNTTESLWTIMVYSWLGGFQK